MMYCANNSYGDYLPNLKNCFAVVAYIKNLHKRELCASPIFTIYRGFHSNLFYFYMYYDFGGNFFASCKSL